MKKNLILLFFFLFPMFVQANTIQPQSVSQQQMVPYESCLRYYNVNKEKLFYTVLTSITESNFKIIEIQSKNGFILFNVWEREFLATISAHNPNTSFFKITPANGNYFFSPWIIQRVFINVNKNLGVTN